MRDALLQPVAREAVTEDQIGDVRVATDDGVLIERVVLIEARPGGEHLEREEAAGSARRRVGG